MPALVWRTPGPASHKAIPRVFICDKVRGRLVSRQAWPDRFLSLSMDIGGSGSVRRNPTLVLDNWVVITKET